MAIFVPVVDGVQVELVFTLDGRVLSNRLWFTFDNPPFGLTELESLAAGVLGWYSGMILPSLSQSLTLVVVRASDWTADPPPAVGTQTTALLGGNTSGCHSANVSVVVPFRWPLGFREKRNKHYVPGIPLDQVALNTVSDELTDALFEGYAALIDAARLFEPTSNWRWRVASAFVGGSARSEQLVRSSQGPVNKRPFLLGQRRRRLT